MGEINDNFAIVYQTIIVENTLGGKLYNFRICDVINGIIKVTSCYKWQLIFSALHTRLKVVFHFDKSLFIASLGTKKKKKKWKYVLCRNICLYVFRCRIKIYKFLMYFVIKSASILRDRLVKIE